MLTQRASPQPSSTPPRVGDNLLPRFHAEPEEIIPESTRLGRNVGIEGGVASDDHRLNFRIVESGAYTANDDDGRIEITRLICFRMAKEAARTVSRSARFVKSSDKLLGGKSRASDEDSSPLISYGSKGSFPATC
jgi:hypothetical protein